MDTGTIIALGGLALALIAALVTAILRFGKVETAAEGARQAQMKADAVGADLSEFKERVARDYATAKMVSDTEHRVVEAINRLAERIDRILEARNGTQPPHASY